MKDSLPETNRDVLACTTVGYVDTGSYDPELGWRLNGIGLIDNVTRWQPLPKAPNS